MSKHWRFIKYYLRKIRILVSFLILLPLIPPGLVAFNENFLKLGYDFARFDAVFEFIDWKVSLVIFLLFHMYLVHNLWKRTEREQINEIPNTLPEDVKAILSYVSKLFPDKLEDIQSHFGNAHEYNPVSNDRDLPLSMAQYYTAYNNIFISIQGLYRERSSKIRHSQAANSSLNALTMKLRQFEQSKVSVCTNQDTEYDSQNLFNDTSDINSNFIDLLSNIILS